MNDSSRIFVTIVDDGAEKFFRWHLITFKLIFYQPLDFSMISFRIRWSTKNSWPERNACHLSVFQLQFSCIWTSKDLSKQIRDVRNSSLSVPLFQKLIAILERQLRLHQILTWLGDGRDIS